MADDPSDATWYAMPILSNSRIRLQPLTIEDAPGYLAAAGTPGAGGRGLPLDDPAAGHADPSGDPRRRARPHRDRAGSAGARRAAALRPVRRRLRRIHRQHVVLRDQSRPPGPSPSATPGSDGGGGAPGTTRHRSCSCSATRSRRSVRSASPGTPTSRTSDPRRRSKARRAAGGVLRKHRLRRDGTWRDTVQYSMTDDDWPAAAAAFARQARAVNVRNIVTAAADIPAFIPGRRRIPVIAGIGQVANKDDERIVHPMELLEAAARMALDDAGIAPARIGGVLATPLSVYSPDDPSLLLASPPRPAAGSAHGHQLHRRRAATPDRAGLPGHLRRRGRRRSHRRRHRRCVGTAGPARGPALAGAADLALVAGVGAADRRAAATRVTCTSRTCRRWPPVPACRAPTSRWSRAPWKPHGARDFAG